MNRADPLNQPRKLDQLRSLNPESPDNDWAQYLFGDAMRFRYEQYRVTTKGAS